MTDRRFVRGLGLSTLGSVLPAGIGVVGAAVLSLSAPHGVAASVLLVWTVAGYLALTDFGLTRSASRLVAEGSWDVAPVLRRLWPVSLTVGVILAAVTASILGWLADGFDSLHPAAMRVLVLFPVVYAIQFPVIGVLEGRGQYGVLAGYRIGTAMATFLLPGLLAAFTGTSITTMVGIIFAFRLFSLVFLLKSAGIGPRDVPSTRGHPAAAWAGTMSEMRIGHVVTWVAVSSLVGPLLLYVDRAFLAQIASSSVWVFYVTVSEMLLKTYIVPTALLAVCFPWLVANWRAQSERIRSILKSAVPVTTLALAGLAGTGGWMAGQQVAAAMGVPPSLQTSMRWVLAIATAGTIFNWASQGYIAVLHAVDGQRSVALSQAFVAVPYFAALFMAFETQSAVALISCWGVRILVVFLMLWRLSELYLRESES